MPGDRPLVSVLMTAYNREQYIEEAIESILSSTYNNFELIIVDDGSTDNTVSLAKKYLAKDNRVRLHLNPKNLGDYPNRNKAVSVSNGEYIMFCDSDDSFFPDTIDYCVNAMQEFPQAGIGLYYYSPEKLKPFIMNKADALRTHFFENPILTIGPGGSIMHRDFFLGVGKYPEKYGPANDMYFNLKVCCKSDILFLPRLFLNYRIHEGQEKNNAYSYIYNNYRYLEDAVNELDLGLTDVQLNYIRKKNKRRFAVHAVRYLFKTRSISATRNLWQKAGFNFKNFLVGIFHF